MTAVMDFMETPLVAWVQTFDVEGQLADFSELSEGLFLYDVFKQISNQDVSEDEVGKPADRNARLRTWTSLLTAILDYYQDVLGQFIVTQLPNIATLATEPSKDESIAGLEKVLLLLLGCAVQSADRARFITNIKSLDVSVQEALVGHIQQVTDDPNTTLRVPHNTVSLAEEVYPSLHRVTYTLANERNMLHERVSTLSRECVYLRAELNGHQGLVSPPHSLEDYHVNQDLIVARNKLNTLTQDFEERGKQLCEAQDELDQSKDQLTGAKEQNMRLKREMKLASVYREQVEEFREKASRVDALEQEVTRQKDLLNELQFYKVRVQELQEDNDSLLEAQGRLEEQASCAHKRSEALMDELVKVQMQLEGAVSEQEHMSVQLTQIEEEKSMLEQQLEKDAGDVTPRRGLSRMRSYTSSEFLTSSMLQLPATSTPARTMSDELKDGLTERMGEVEAENEALHSEARQAASHLAEVEKELARLRAKSEHDMQQKVSEIELQTKELRKKASRELTREFEARVTEIEQRSLNLKQRVTEEFKQRLSQLEVSNRSLQKRADEAERKSEVAEKRGHEAETRLKLTQESWAVVKQQATRLESLNRELVGEREEFKQRIAHAKEDTQNRAKHLEKQVDMLQFRTSQLEAQNARLSQTMVETQGELGHYISVVASADRQEKRSAGPARIVYIPPSGSPAKPSSVHAELKRSSSSCSSTDMRRLKRESGRSHRSPRPASVIGMTDHRGALDPRLSQQYRSPSSQHRSSLQMLNKPHHSRGPPADRPRSVSISEHPHTPVAHCPRHSSPHPASPQPFTRNDRSRRTMPVKMESQGRQRHSSSSSVASDTTLPDNRPLREMQPPPPPVFTRSQSFREPGSRSYREAASHGYSHHRGSTQSLAGFPDNPQPFHDPDHPPTRSTPTYSNENATHNGHYVRDSDQDSGCDRSPNGGYSLDDTRGSSRCSSPHSESFSQPSNGYHIVASETTVIQQREIRSASHPQHNDKWRLLVEKVVELQDKNQLLSMENTEMRRSVKSLNHCGERISVLENQNLQLELENRKLKRICDSLQYSLTGKNAYDKRTYHFYTNV